MTAALHRVRDLQFRNEIGVMVALLFAVQFLFPKSIPFGIYGLGIVSGSSLALHAMAVILVYRSNGFINFAHLVIGGGAATMFGLSANYRPAARLVENVCPPCIDRVGPTFTTVNYWASAALALGLSVLTSYLIYIFIVRRFEGSSRLVLTVSTFFINSALFSAYIQLGDVLTTREQREAVVKSNAPLPFDWTIDLDPVRFHATDLFTVLAAIAAIVGLWAYFRWSAVGTAIRASAENPGRAETLGVNVTKVTSRVWIIVGLLSGIGALLPAMTVTGSDVGAANLVQVLAVVVVARLTSLPMGVFAALVLGILRQGSIWAFDTAVVIDGSFVVVIAVVLLLQRYRTSRADTEQTGWQGAKEIRPIPRELRAQPTVKKWLRVLGVSGAAITALYPWVMSPSQTDLGSYVMINAIIGLSLLILTGWAGQISLGQLAFAAVGGYVAAAFDLPFLIALPAGALAGAAVAVLVGLPALKLRGLHLAISTYAFAVAVALILVNPQYLGKRLPTTLARPTLLGMKLNDPRSFYYFTLGALVLVIVAVAGLRRSRIARVLIAARDNEQGVQSFGISLVRARLTAFALSGFFAAFAGAILAYQQRGVKSNGFGADASISIFIATVIGGLGSISGPVIGAVYDGLFLIFEAPPIVYRLTSGIGGLILLLAIPGGLAKVIFDLRDAALRRVAQRNRIEVASLMADRKASDVDGRAPIAPKLRPRGGAVFVPTRYGLEDQWALGVTDNIVQAGAVATDRTNGDTDGDATSFAGLSGGEPDVEAASKEPVRG